MKIEFANSKYDVKSDETSFIMQLSSASAVTAFLQLYIEQIAKTPEEAEKLHEKYAELRKSNMAHILNQLHQLGYVETP